MRMRANAKFGACGDGAMKSSGKRHKANGQPASQPARGEAPEACVYLPSPWPVAHGDVETQQRRGWWNELVEVQHCNCHRHQLLCT